MGLTKFGVFIRKFRLDQGMLLRDMAKSLGISPAYLSGMETGNKPIPDTLAEKISDIYKLDNNQVKDLQTSIIQSQRQVTVNTNGDALNNELMTAFSRGIDSLSDEDKRKILNMFK